MEVETWRWVGTTAVALVALAAVWRAEHRQGFKRLWSYDEHAGAVSFFNDTGEAAMRVEVEVLNGGTLRESRGNGYRSRVEAREAVRVLMEPETPESVVCVRICWRRARRTRTYRTVLRVAPEPRRELTFPVVAD